MNITEYLSGNAGITLSAQQAQAVAAPDGKALLLAVPGAGKTTVVTARAARLMLELGVDPSGILVLTYNRAAARDMSRRWEQLFGSVTRIEPGFSTIHSFCYRLLGEYAKLRGTQVPRLLEGDSTAGKSRIISGIYRELTGQFLAEDQLNRIINLMGYCVNMRCDPETAGKGHPQEQEFFPEICRRYTQWKRENFAMDFDDMLLFACTALERSEQLRRRTAESYSHILVDEAQDTSRLQQEIIALITRENLFMVGDEDQSIYGFRGAFPQGLLDFFERYPEAVLMKLEQNYRSTPEIVAAADRLIRSNKQRYDKNIFTMRPEGGSLKLVTDISVERQYDAIAKEAVEMSAKGSVAVLYRASYSGIGVAARLAALGAEYSAAESRLGYTGDFITRDISNILRLAQCPGDKKAFNQVYFRLGCGISRELAAQVLEAPRDDILDWLIQNASGTDRNTGKLIYTRRILAGMNGKSPYKQIDDIIEKLGYLDILEKRGPSGYMTAGYIQRLAVIRQLSRDCGNTECLLERFAAAEQLLGIKGRKTIRLSTVHSAKGQEYDHVIIADVLEGVFPAADVVEYSTLGSGQQMEEETRLFYTAVTRARNSVTIYAPDNGCGRELLPGRFVAMSGLGGQVTGPWGVQVGSDLSHTFFGTGVIVEINTIRRLVTVDFRHYGRKSFGMDALTDKRLFKLFQ